MMLNFESIIVKHVTAPLWRIRDGRPEEIYFRREFRLLDDLPTHELRRRQLDRLRKIIRHSRDNCPYYARQISHLSISPENIELEDIAQLPILTKEAIRQNLNSMVATNMAKGNLFDANTGGSTGVPMRFVRDRRCLSLRRAQESLFDSFMGYEVGDRAALFVSASHTDSLLGTWKEALRNRTDSLLLRFDPQQTKTTEMHEFYKSFVRFRPKFIKCFPNALAIFTEFVQEHDLQVPDITAISCTGENVYEWQKNLFSRVWNAPVYERYGTKECGVVSGEREVGAGQSIFLEGVHVELLDDQGRQVPDGVPGRVVLTDLFNYGMPLIRYEIGDIAVALPNPDCGNTSGFPKLKKIIGRDRDIIIAADGTKKPGYLFVEELGKANLDAKFQIVQRSIGTIDVRIAEANIDRDAMQPIIAKFRELLGGGDCVKVVPVEKIAKDPSGKYRYVKSELTWNSGDANGKSKNWLPETIPEQLNEKQ